MAQVHALITLENGEREYRGIILSGDSEEFQTMVRSLARAGVPGTSALVVLSPTNQEITFVFNHTIRASVPDHIDVFMAI